MLVDPVDHSLVQSSDSVLARLSDGLAMHTSPETHASVIELASGIHVDVAGAVDQLASLRERLAKELQVMGLAAASAGTYPLQGFPRTGTARLFSCYRDYTGAVDALIASGAIPDPTFLWWDVRLQPALGTVEVRVMDAQSALADSAALIALVRALARLALEDEPGGCAVGPEVVAENRFLAARDGLAARLIDPAQRRLVPARSLVDALLARCQEHADAVDAVELDRVARLMLANGADRQRARARQDGLAGLIPSLIKRYAASAARWGRASDPRDSTKERFADPRDRIMFTSTEGSDQCAAGLPTPVPPSC